MFNKNGATIGDDVAICLFDADNDKDLDACFTKGGYQWALNDKAYQDELYINTGKGVFVKDSNALPILTSNKACIRATDYDMDGDIDLFTGGGSLPGSYPMAAQSKLLRNDTKNDVIKFTDVTATTAPQILQTGLLTDANWSDVDNDGDPDLIVARLWGAVSFFKNEAGKFQLQQTNMDAETGWWNSVTAADIDNDGDMDYVAGNFGWNGFYKASPQMPAAIYCKDYDGNGSMDFITSTYRPEKIHGAYKAFPVPGRDQLAEELPFIKKQFPDYGSYASAGMDQLLATLKREGEIKMSVVNFSSGWMENKGNFQFAFHAFPAAAQYAPVYGIVAADFNSDGNIDIALNGNEFSMHPLHGRIDAMNGLLLQGDGAGNFKPLSVAASGLFIPGNGKALAQLPYGNSTALLASQNLGIVKLFVNKFIQKTYGLQAGETSGLIELKNGRKRKEEYYNNGSYQSQSAAFIQVNPSVKQVQLFKGKKISRTIN